MLTKLEMNCHKPTPHLKMQVFAQSKAQVQKAVLSQVWAKGHSRIDDQIWVQIRNRAWS